MKKQKNKKLILWFDEVNNKDVWLVWGKNASLGELYTKLTKTWINVPFGFAVTSYSYFDLLEKTGAKKKVESILEKINTSDVVDLAKKWKQIRNIVLSLDFPKELESEILDSYKSLSKFYKTRNIEVAVRSSATAEDLPDASFAWQQDTYLNIKWWKDLLLSCKKCFASLFTDRAISYRHDKWFSHFDVGLSIGVQKMVRSDKASSGVMFSIDTESGFEDVVLINSIYWLGENIVQWTISPDEFFVRKTWLKKSKNPIISKKLGSKKLRMIYAKNNQHVKNIAVNEIDQNKFSLSDKEIVSLAKWAVIIENHYGKSMDMEWAKDGDSGKLFIVQARPETVHSQKDANVLEEYILSKKWKVVVSGPAVWSKIGSGKAHVIKNVKDISKFKAWEVLVTEMTDPDWEPIMKIASAIVTNSGGRTCHAAIISRELGIPCIVWTGDATVKIKNRQKLTVSSAEWEVWHVYDGILPFKVKKTDIKKLKKIKTKIMMNLANPEIAFQSSFIPNDGVGLAREEFIINSYIKIHPLALIECDKKKRIKCHAWLDQVSCSKIPGRSQEWQISKPNFISKPNPISKSNLISKSDLKKIEELTKWYKSKKEFFVDKLAEGIAKLWVAFYPKPVIVRMSDFKSNEYANLIWGKSFEPNEENPMIGRRGASRYYDPKYEKAFGLECKAIKKVREEMWLDNVILMIPFCRTVEEWRKVLKTMEKYGLKKWKDGLEVYIMVEIPSNVLLIEEFAKIFDGFSIGSNDLTQLTLGLDRDSWIIAHVGDERNNAVKMLILAAIKWAKKHKKKIGICGQAPSDFPDFARFVVDAGIDSISLNPDTVIKTRMFLAE